MHMRTPPFLGPTDPEFLTLPEALRREYLTWIESPRIDLLDSRGQEDSPCIWLNQGTGQCRHYASRPQVCRDFEVGSEACLAFRQQATLSGSELSMAVAANGLVQPRPTSGNCDWNQVIEQVRETHTAKLMRGASRLAADLDTDAATAAMVLGACLEIEGVCEGRR